MNRYEFLYNKEFYNLDVSRQYLDSKELSCEKIEECVILPHRYVNGVHAGGVLTSDGEILYDSGLHRGISFKYDYDKSVVDNEGKAIYLGMLCNIWGHSITDCISRMWFLFTDEYKEKYNDYDLVYILMNDELNVNFVRFLEIMGIPVNKLKRIDKVTKYNTLIYPDECFYPDKECYRFTEEYRLLIERVKKYAKDNIRKIDYDKIYFAYSKYAKVRNFGEENLISFFKKKGYKIIAPEKHSFEEQLNMLIQCKEFASTLGSGSHNTIFLGEDSHVILIPRAHYLGGYQQTLDFVMENKVTYVDSTMSVLVNNKAPWEGPFCYIISEQLLNYFSENVDKNKLYEHNLKCIRKYLKNSSNIYLSSPNASEYYGNELQKYERYMQSKRDYRIKVYISKLYLYIRNLVKIRF